MEMKKQGIKKKAYAALKSLARRSTKSAESEASNSLSSTPAESHPAETAVHSIASSEQATDAGSVTGGLRIHSSASDVAKPGSPGNKNERLAGQPSDPPSLTPVPGQRTSRYLVELNEAIDEFRKNYLQFSKANSEYILIDDELENVIPDIATVGDVKQIAKLFEQNVMKTIRINERKKLLTESHWPTQVGHFLSKLYPVAKLSCSLMGAIAEGAAFSPLSGAASGLGIILQLLGDESGRSEDFILELRRIEDQAALLADNPQCALDLESTQTFLNEKSTGLMTAAIKFLNSALIHFSKGFFGNLSKTVVNGPDVYQTGKTQLRNAISQYDQAVMHLTARSVAAMTIAQEAQHNGEFLKWLCPSSYWRVEDFLSSFRKERSEGTLDWALKLPEFREWRLSDLHCNSDRRVTWIKGALGLGKSIMAAYFIDLLKTQYRNAIVAYFFCRSKEPGLTTARDILRTLAYQCARDNRAARTALEKLKSEGFQITTDLGIRYLIEKLLIEPLQSVQEVYVVLDGLDEADDLTLDRTDPAGRPDLQVLLECLADIPLLRLLCISRPSAQIQTIIPNAFPRTISKRDNADDIETYVLTEVGKSRNLKRLFKQDPVQYFNEHGEGVFLWVKLVLKQLEKAKTASSFQKYLTNFSAGSEVTDKIENLYRTILLRIKEDDKKTVIEIIRWILVAKVPLSIGTLKALVEWCQNDTMVSFADFLDETCGSLLQFLPQSEDEDLVELVHETFKSFITDRSACLSSFVIDKPEAECYATMQCLKSLRNHTTAPNEVCEYSSRHWVGHLSGATASQSKRNVLVALYAFLASDAIQLWIKWICHSRDYIDFASPTVPVEIIRQWVRDCTHNHSAAVSDYRDCETEQAMNWQRACLGSSFLLEETIGKAAVKLWLHESFDQARGVTNCFVLGLTYYWRRPNRSRSNFEELDELIATNFHSLSVWANPTGPSVPVIDGNLGLAFYGVREFDKCLQHLRGDKSIHKIDKQLLPYVAVSLFATRDYDGIIQAFDSRICDVASMVVLRAYQIKGAYDRAIDVFQAAHKRDPTSSAILKSLCIAYEARRGDADKMFETAKSALVLREEWGYWYLSRACFRKGNHEEAIHIYEASIDENPKDGGAWLGLARSYTATGEDDRAIDTLESGLLENPKDFVLSSALVRAAVRKGDYPEATQRLKRGIKNGYLIRGTAVKGLMEVFPKLSDQKGLITELKQIAQTYPFDAEISHHLCEAYMEAGEYEDAISLSMSQLTPDNSAVPASYLRLLFQDLCKACRAKGDHTAAINMFTSKAKLDNFDLYIFQLSAILALYDGNHSAGARQVFETIVGEDDNVGIWAWPVLLRVSARDRDFDAVVERMEKDIDDGQMEASERIAYELMNAYYARGDNKKAVAKLTKIAYRLPLLQWPWHILGEMYRRMGNPEEAINLYESKFRRLPIDYSFHQRLASLYLSTSNYLRAIECYEVVEEMIPEIRHDPEQLAPYMNVTNESWDPFDSVPMDERFREHLLWYPISQAHKGRGDDHKAHEIYDAVINVYQENVDEEEVWLQVAYSDRAWTNMKVEDSAFTWPALNKLPKYALLCALGEVYKAKQAVKPALETFLKAEKLLPSNSYIENVIAELEEQLQKSFGGDQIS